MAFFYFSQFPKVNYTISSGKTVIATDITKRFKMIDSFMKNKYVFYTYSVKEGERADVIAYKYYNDASLDWLIFMINSIYDPLLQWPMTYSEMEQYITNKYGSLESAKQTVYEYYQILQPREILYDGTIVEEQSLVIDQTAYALLDDPDRSFISQYDYEKQENENRRIIKLVDKSFIPSILREFKGIFV